MKKSSKVVRKVEKKSHPLMHVECYCGEDIVAEWSEMDNTYISDKDAIFVDSEHTFCSAECAANWSCEELDCVLGDVEDVEEIGFVPVEKRTSSKSSKKRA